MVGRALAGAFACAIGVGVLAAPGGAQSVDTGPVQSTFHLTPYQVGVLMAGHGEVHPSQGRRFAVIVYQADAICGPGATVREWRADDGTVPWPVVGNSGCVPPPPDPPPPIGDLVAAAAAAIPRPEVLVDPAVRGLVGLEARFWYEGETDVAVATGVGASAGAAAASAIEFVWRDGSTPLGSSSSPGTRAEPAVRTVFTRHGTRVLTLAVSWHGVGAVSDGGTLWLVDLGTVTTTSPGRDYDVPEAQALITG